ncbi:MAG TPA: hypothetical protein VME20_12770 [Acidimicrobiales bacterium]|nr:hypothetical protein [Acidimicrobiales bacterium]
MGEPDGVAAAREGLAAPREGVAQPGRLGSTRSGAAPEELCE